MATAQLTANDALPIARSRAQAATGSAFPGAAALYSHADQLWESEWDSYEALNSLGLGSAAACAYARRTAAAALTRILVCAL